VSGKNDRENIYSPTFSLNFAAKIRKGVRKNQNSKYQEISTTQSPPWAYRKKN